MLEAGATLDRTAETAEVALEALHGTPQALLDLLPVAVCISDADGEVVRYNNRAAELLHGHSRRGEHGSFRTHTLLQPDGTPLPADAAPLTLALCSGTTTIGKPVIIERRDQSRVPATVDAAPLRDAEGRIIGAAACYQDMSERVALEEARQVEHALRESQQRLAATYENAGIGIAEADADGRLLRLNEAYCAITGYEREELLGRVFHTLTHPEDRAKEQELFARQTEGKLDRYSLEKRYCVKGGNERWVAVSSSAVAAPDGTFLYSVRILRDITARKQAQERQQMLMGELNHRIKNILATVQSLAYQTIRKATDPTTFYEKFQGRLMALGKAHSLLTRSQWTGATLRDIIEEQALPFREDKGQRILLTGGAVELSPEQAVVLGMVFHELLTNAVKHGSLSKLTGRVRIDWKIRKDLHPDQTWLSLQWRESEGPVIHPPEHQGFGSVFIARSVRDQLNGNARLDYKPSGLVCLLEIPLNQ